MGKMIGSIPVRGTMKTCQGKCRLDQQTGLCLGCQRSMDDIKQAYKEFLTRQAKSNIMGLQ